MLKKKYTVAEFLKKPKVQNDLDEMIEYMQTYARFNPEILFSVVIENAMFDGIDLTDLSDFEKIYQSYFETLFNERSNSDDIR